MHVDLSSERSKSTVFTESSLRSVTAKVPPSLRSVMAKVLLSLRNVMATDDPIQEDLVRCGTKSIALSNETSKWYQHIDGVSR